MEYTKLLYICDCFVRAWVHKSAVFMSFIPLYRCTVVFYCRTVVTYSATVFTATYWMKPKYWVIYRSVIKVDSIPLYYHPRTAFTGLGPGASFNWTVYHYTYCYTNIPKSTLPSYILSNPGTNSGAILKTQITFLNWKLHKSRPFHNGCAPKLCNPLLIIWL